MFRRFRCVSFFSAIAAVSIFGCGKVSSLGNSDDQKAETSDAKLSNVDSSDDEAVNLKSNSAQQSDEIQKYDDVAYLNYTIESVFADDRPTLDAPPPPPLSLSEEELAEFGSQLSGKYDDAEWHYGGDFPGDVPNSYGFTHIGFYLTWAAERGLISDFIREETGEVVETVLARRESPIHLLEVWDGKLVEDMLDDDGNAFSQEYYRMEPTPGVYIVDYVRAFGENAVYQVAPTWENYDTIKPLIEKRFDEWRAKKDKAEK